ncbi:YeeE/YedE thiosulfate transporter family protein [Billgrantia tianxiuensis]|uniref:YeeE/YedE thiosulfate transporter family protein n=1 Tax=Billgrantia tianxiuensis TaxID=2497861 RepID=UPI001F27BADF|nr:YeeE/YedE thiosulfate transporter family protein [Halomonas tianxiuensis]
MTHTELVVWSGLAIGVLFGSAAQLSGFCLLRGLANTTAEGDTRKLRAFALAMGVALIGSQSLAAAGLVSLDASLYATPSLAWLAVPWVACCSATAWRWPTAAVPVPWCCSAAATCAASSCWYAWGWRPT